jgi:pimeloyl-ACP methyl ester carboxylesterase
MKAASLTRGLSIVVALVAGSLSCAANRAAAQRTTYVIVHGAWGGAWDWRTVDSLLTSGGHQVYRVQFTGLGERVHLATPSIGLDTHIDDVVNTIVWEQLTSVVLVGHSYGGMVITGVADRIPDRVRKLVYVDAFLPVSGESVLSLLGESGRAWVSSARGGFLYPGWVADTAKAPKDVPHPVKTFTDTLRLTNSGRVVPGSYILTIAPGATSPDDFQAYADRAASRGWPVIRMEADHIPERSAPGRFVALLLSLR